MSLVEFISKWQTLVGAVLGGIFALATAFIVAHTMRRREELASGMVVVADLAVVETAAEALNSLVEQEKIRDEEFPLWFSDKLVGSHPKLSTLFEASVARLMPLDVCLAAHLSLFQRIYSEIQIMINRLSQDYNYFHEHKKLLRPKDHMQADYGLIPRHFSRAIEHAKCAEEIIIKIILSKASMWNRIRRYFYMNEKEKECKNILEKGTTNMLFQRGQKSRAR
jgi:hypothetical protein